MANPSDVLMQLQAKLDTKYMTKNAEVTVPDDLEEDLEEDIGSNASGATASGFGNSLANKRYQAGDQDLDVDDAEAVDEPYVTNRAITPATNDSETRTKSKIKIEGIKKGLEVALALALEQAASPQANEEEMSPTDPGPDAPGHTDTAAPAEEAPPAPEGGEMPADPGMGGMGAEGGMEGGMGMEQEDPLASKTPSELGRIYELKKIYTRLTTIESYLSESSDPDLLRIRLLVSKSIELFEILSSNIPVYKPPKAPKERIDEIIIIYYKFLKQVYESVADYYKKNSAVKKGDGLTKSTIKFTDKELV
jgi:hypothetical protein